MPAGRPSILVTRMLAQMCRNTWKSKEMPIHNGTHKGGAAAEGDHPPFVDFVPPPLWTGVGRLVRHKESLTGPTPLQLCYSFVATSSDLA